ncbi:Lcl C-terminal domain-containing protein [Eionea flava]
MIKKRYILLLFTFLALMALLVSVIVLFSKAAPTTPDPTPILESSPSTVETTTITLSDTPPQPSQLSEKQQQAASAYKLWTETELSDKTVDNRFYKIDNDGGVLPQESVSWSCVYDDLTGLLWEVKVSDGSWQDNEHTYSWFQPSAQEIEELSLVAGSEAIDLPYDPKRGKADGGTCYDVYCDTYHYNQAFNDANICGSSQWRLPYAHELGYLDHQDQYYPDIDTTFFPNTAIAYYWSRTETPNLLSLAWAVDFKDGFPYISEKRIPYRIRLVTDALWLHDEIHLE